MATFKFNCSHCQQRLAAEEKHSGNQLQCPTCHHLIHVPRAPWAETPTQKESGRTWDTYLPQAQPGDTSLPPKSNE